MLTNQTIRLRYLHIHRPGDLARVHLAHVACPTLTLCGFEAADMVPVEVEAGAEAGTCKVCVEARGAAEWTWARRKGGDG